MLNLDRDFSMSCSQSNLTEVQRIAEVLAEREDAKTQNLKGRVLRKLAGWRGYERSDEYLMKAIEHQLEIMQLRNSEESIHSSNMFDEIQVLQDIFSKQRHAEGNNYCFLLGALTQRVQSDAQRQIRWEVG